MPSLRIAVVGHVEHVTIGRAPAVPRPGEIAHLTDTLWIPGGGGGTAFFQLTRSPGEILGNDDAAADVLVRLQATGARVHAARRDEPHTRDMALITPDGERTIVVAGEPLQPRRDDPLPWHLLATCDAAYFTAQDPDALRAAREARLLVVTARRIEALTRSGVRADVVVGSATDARESRALADYAVAPGALVLTEGRKGGRIETAEGTARFDAAPPPAKVRGAYGAGDNFAAALTWYLARGLPLADACARASMHGAAVLQGIDPLEHQLALE